MRTGIFLFLFFFTSFSHALPSKSPIQEVINLQTSVKSQKSRGTCTIFSTLGLFESLLIKNGLSNKEIDLSEEWLEYIAVTRQTDEGSTVNRNIKKLRFFGLVHEETWPYIGEKWFVGPETIPLAKERCWHLKIGPQANEDFFQSCLVGHRDPRLLRAEDQFVFDNDEEFYHIRQKAKDFKETHIFGKIQKRKSYKIKKQRARHLLSEGQAVIMGLKLYYGSWNHSKTDKFDIQKRDKKKWFNGVVTYPEPGSRDRLISGEKGGGHSLVIVGYDDEKIVTSKMLMEDGSWKEFTYKGVYYFKNSWGVKGFGKRFVFEGQPLPGYGMITYNYAHELGTFFELPYRP